MTKPILKGISHSHEPALFKSGAQDTDFKNKAEGKMSDASISGMFGFFFNPVFQYVAF